MGEFYPDGVDEHANKPTAIEFARNNRDRIRQRRRELWGNPKHPGRWTGNGIKRDAERADEHLARDFRRYHLTQYTQDCWATHGSTLIGLREIHEDRFPYYAATAFEWSTKFALVAAEGALRCTGLWGPAVEILFDQHCTTAVVEKDTRAFFPHARADGD